MTTSTVYANATEQAWSTYTSTSGRTSDYIKLLQSHYDAFLVAAKKYDTIADVLKGTDAPSSANLVTAEGATDTMDTSLTAIVQVTEAFPDMDSATIKKAASLDQSALTKTYQTREQKDDNLVIALNNVLYACQMLYATAKYGSTINLSGD